MIERVTLMDFIENAKTPKQVKAALKNAGFHFDDISEECGYLNLHIPFPDGYIRIYKRKDGKIVEQKWTKCEYKYSGIPTFEPSGRRSF